MNDPLPVRIVGGGLAGLSLGIGLRRAGVPVEIFESGGYPRHRVCGEFVTGLDDAAIQALGIGSVFVGSGSHRTATWFRRGRPFWHLELPAPARAISRYVLDARLAALFGEFGGQLHVHTRHAPPPVAPGWVGAGGRRLAGSSPWIGLKVHARDLSLVDDLELHLGDAAYVGLSAVEDGWINVCGLFRRRAGLSPDREHALAVYLRASGLAGVAERLAAAVVRPGSATAVAGLACSGRAAVAAGLRVGDAGGMIPPFTGNGMAMAINGAALALDPLVAWARGAVSWEETVRCVGKRLRQEIRLRLASAAMLHPFVLHRPLQSLFAAAARAGLLPALLLYRALH
ncbi:MAG TPA: hypothetical protein VK163_05850 [Opitutaceae bacterium]|nr:hypothetical protein [Opitutaceae bacterium]